MNKIEYYTDGACSGNPGPGGFAVVRLAKEYIPSIGVEKLFIPFYYNKYFENTTNNRMELEAIIYALKTCSIGYTNYHYIIYSDSAYVVNICNDWIWKWADNNWKRAKNKPIENLDLITELYHILLELKENNFTFEIKKCNGHSGILENELADALASNNMVKFNKLIKENNIWDMVDNIDK